uniref:RRM domain-containing protein n=1 Tax=Salmo trutta TaxID=8032 RepID=A0A674CAY2_SALTR
LHIGGQWNVWVPRDVSAMTNSCVVIYFTFMYPYPHYKGRTKLIGDLHQRNCTLLISNIGTEHSLRYYFRADLDGANIYTYPDFSELKAHIDIPAEIVADDVGMLQHPPDNCPENSLEIQWMYTDYMPEPHYTLDYVEESNTAALSSTLTFTTKPMHNGRQTYCTTLHHPNSTYQSYLSSDATLILEESMCTVVREGVQCVFLATGNPEPIIEFYLPDKNINDTDGLYNYYMHMDGHMSMGMIKLREKGEQPGHCSVSNMYGSESFYLELQQEKKYMMAGIVGTIVGVAVIAFIIAAVRYVENGNPGRYLVSKLENPALYYSTVKKDKQCLRKKVGVKVEEVLLAVGEQVGAEFIHSASRMNKAVVVFMKRENLVGRLIASGIFVRDVLVPVLPLSTPSTRVVVANLPPFITDDQIRKELSRFGKFASGFRVLSAGFQAAAVKHVVSFRRASVYVSEQQ